MAIRTFPSLSFVLFCFCFLPFRYAISPASFAFNSNFFEYKNILNLGFSVALQVGWSFLKIQCRVFAIF